MPLHPRDSVFLLRKNRTSLLFKTTDSLCVKNTLPSIKQVNATDDTKWQVKALPNDWVPNTKPSKVVANLLKQKEVEHAESLKRMKEKMVKVNIDVEQDVRFQSELTKGKLAQNKSVLEEAMRTIELPDDINKIAIDKEKFDEIINVINAEIRDSLEAVAQLHDILMHLEKGRSQKFKVILKNAYDEMLAVCYKLPYQLQEFFELEILNINQITLCNYRAYEELKLQIMLKLENDRRLWLQTLFDRKEDYMNRKKEVLKEIFKGRHSSSFDVFAQVNTPVVKLPISDNAGNSVSMETINFLSHTLAKFLISFDLDVKIMKKLIEDTIKKIYMANYDQIQNLDIDVNNMHSDYELSELKEIVKNTFLESANAVQMVTKWDEFRRSTQVDFLENVRVFTAAIHLWDEHFFRMFQLRELTVIDLDKLIQNNSHNEDMQLSTANILVDKLREASSEEELKQLMGEIKTCLDSIMKIADSNYKKEIAFFNKYKNLSAMATSLFLSQLTVFSTHYSKNEDVDPTLQRGRASWMEICIKEEPPAIILGFEKVLKSLKNWMFGLQETIESSKEKYERDFASSAESWTEGQCFRLYRKFEIKNIMYKPKFQRIYEYIYKIRLAELKQHEERLERHKLAINVEINRLKEVADIKQTAFEDIAAEFDQQLPDYVNKSEKIKTSLGVENLISQLKSMKTMYANKMEETKSSFEEAIESTLVDIRMIDVDYMKCLKLFNEGGNYCPSEVKNYKGIFNKISKKLTKDVRPLQKQINQRLSKGFHLLDVKELPVLNKLIQCKDELKFHEYTISEIRSVHAKIKDATYNLSYKYKIVEQLLAHLMQAANNNIGSLEYLEEFVQNCEYLEGAFQEAKLLLIQKNPFRLNPRLFRDEYHISPSTLKSTMSVVIDDGAQFNMVLFESLNEGHDYIANIVDILYTSLTEVQNKAKEFYGKNRTFLKKVTIPNIKTYMLELLSKYLYYELQCEEVWLEVAVEYSFKIEEVFEFIRDYYKRSVKKYVDMQVQEFRKKCFQYMSKINNRNNEVDDKYRDLHKKLKPLLGHPKNKALLEELEIQREELNAYVLEAQEEILSTLDDFKEKVQMNFKTFGENVWKMENKLKDNLQTYVTLIVENGSLLNLIRSRIEYLGSIICGDYYSNDISDKYNQVIVELNAKLNELKKGLKITSESLLNFSKSLCSVKKILEEISSVSTNMGVTNSICSISVMELVEFYKNQQEVCLAKINFSKDLSAISERWNDQWETDVKTIQNLYTVKYFNKMPSK